MMQEIDKMKYVLILLVVVGSYGMAFGQSIGDGTDKIWLPSCPIGTGSDCDKSSLFHDAIAEPFFQSDSVAIGTVIQKEKIDQNSIRFSINVDFYLKNYQPFDLLTATLNNATEPQTFPDVLYYNSPVFNEGDLVFVYLEKTDGQYRLLPESFALDKHEIIGPPPTIHLNKSPSEDVFEQGDEILVSGEVRKVELVKATKEGKRIDARLMLLDSDDRNNIIFSDLMKIDSDGSYNYILDTSKIPPTKYELEINYGPSTFGDRIKIEPDFSIWTPAKQSKFGISSDKIQCRENLTLIKKYDGSPACVKHETISKLVDRGWANADTMLVNHDYVIRKGNVTYGSQYLITGGVVDEIKYDESTNSLIVYLQKSEKGYLQILIQTGVLHSPRELPFTYHVLADGKESSFEQFSPILLKISFEKDTQKITITGEKKTSEISYDSENLDIHSIEDEFVHLNPQGICASITLERMSQDEVEQIQSPGKEITFIEINDRDIQEMPVLDELIRATHLIDFKSNDYSQVEMSLRELVDYEFFIMNKSIAKYGDTQDDYFMKLNMDLDERLADPRKQGFSNEFDAPQIVYDEKVYVLGHTVFWISDEHEPQSLSIHLRDELKQDKRFVTIDDEDLKSIPKIRKAIDEIGTQYESVYASKGMKENPDWNDYREWFEQKKKEFDAKKTYVPGFIYNNEYYDLGFLIC